MCPSNLATSPTYYFHFVTSLSRLFYTGPQEPQPERGQCGPDPLGDIVSEREERGHDAGGQRYEKRLLALQELHHIGSPIQPR